jgi:uncharacterized membrane protein
VISELAKTWWAPMILWVTLLLVVVSIGWYIVGKFRDRDENDQDQSSNLLSNYRDLHSQGDLSDVEYRKIKSVLATKLRGELNDSGEEG